MTYEDVIGKLSRGTSDAVARLWSAVEAGNIPMDMFESAAADLILTANARGVAAADASLRAYIEAETGVPEVARPGVVRTDPGRLQKALTTILATDGDVLMRLQRLAANEPIEAASRAFGDAIRSNTKVKGWRRGLELKPCQLCIWWWREDRVWPDTHPMPRHTGCVCHPVPVISTNVKRLSYEKHSGGYERYRAGLDRRAENNRR